MNDVTAGIPIVGVVTKPLEAKTPDKGASYYMFTVNDYRLGYVSIRVYGDIHETMKNHLSNEGAAIVVNADSVSPWVPEDENKNVKRYTKEGTWRTGKVIINYSATANGFRLYFLPKVTEEGASDSGNTGTQASTGDTVRDGDDSQPTDKPATANAGNSGSNPWDSYQ